MKRVERSLSLKLSLGVLIVAVAIFVVALGLLFLQSRWIIRQQARERAMSVLNTSMHRINRYLNTVETATDINEWLILENMQPDSLLAYSRRIVMLNGNVNGCSITARPGLFPQYGRYFSAYTIREGDTIITAREAEYEYFDKVWYKTPAALGAPCWVDPFVDDNEGLHTSEIIASYCKPLRLPGGEFVGVIATDLSLRVLNQALAEERPYPNSYFIMTGSWGHYLMHPDSTLLFRQTIFRQADLTSQADLASLGHEMADGQRGTMTAVIDGQPCLVCYHPVAGTKWSLALVCPLSDILQPYYKLAYILVPLLLIGLPLILLLCFKTVSLATRPLNRLLSLSQQMAEGRFRQRIIPRSRRSDAVGSLQNAFVTMQESIDRHVSEISKANTETIHRNEQLLAATHAAQEAERQKATFIQNMSHQIRTPLNIIMGFAQVLRQELGLLPTEEVACITEMISVNTKSLHRMVLMLFDSSDTGIAEELKTQSHAPVACNTLARECLIVNKERFPELPVALESDVPDDLCIYTNHLYLWRSLLELLHNSSKFSDGQNIRMRVTRSGAHVRFIFEDTGPGIPESCREQMFVPFSKADDLSEGLGLGLPLVLRHIRNLGGSLTLDPDYHEGCRFTVELPIGKPS